MIDREKVILGLEKCTEHGFDCGVKGKECPYYDWKYNDAETGDCIDRLMLDALELLKEDENRIANYRRWHENQKNTIKELLKAQEPVEPIRMNHDENKYRDHYRCPICDDDLTYEQQYCAECGRAVKWDG